MPTKKVKQVKKLKRDANGKFASKAKTEVKVMPKGDDVGVKPSCGMDADIPGGCGATTTAPQAKLTDVLFLRTSFESSSSGAIYAAKELVALYSSFGYVPKRYNQIIHTKESGQLFAFEIKLEK